MIDVFFDCETTGVNPYCSEIIEAYFAVLENGKIVNDYLLQSQVSEWSEEAEKIHKIPYVKTLLYPKKVDAYRDFLMWLPKDFRFITFANKNTQLGYINFDVAILVNELNLLGCPNYYLENTHKMKPNLSVHSLAKNLHNNNLFSPIKGDKGRISFSQENIFKALFSEPYIGHNAKDDVNYLVRIYNRLLELENENKNSSIWDQSNFSQ